MTKSATPTIHTAIQRLLDDYARWPSDPGELAEHLTAYVVEVAQLAGAHQATIGLSGPLPRESVDWAARGVRPILLGRRPIFAWVTRPWLEQVVDIIFQGGQTWTGVSATATWVGDALTITYRHPEHEGMVRTLRGVFDAEGLQRLAAELWARTVVGGEKDYQTLALLDHFPRLAPDLDDERRVRFTSLLNDALDDACETISRG